MWDGAVIDLKDQPIIPIITHEEMDSSLLEVIEKLKDDPAYKQALLKAYGDTKFSSERILGSMAQFMYTLISANSKYDRVTRDHTETFTPVEEKGYTLFKQKCASCHKGALFTDESFRNVGFPKHPDVVEEAGRGRVTGNNDDLHRFRVPSLRNIEYTAPYGSFGQFASLKDVLDFFSNGVTDYPNLDPILKNNDKKIPLTEEEKEAANLDATNPSEASQTNDDTQNLTDQNGDLEQNEGSDEDPSAPAADQSKANAKNNR